MRICYLLGILLLFICLSVPANGNLYDTLECYNKHGRCRRLCFHNERPIGTCTGGRQHCCK
ncbi:gallinacin-13-like [Eublepharis macularius]|uniref:Gallinacin-13-like n=1 Tax=Eublepharis macularius TaxID=481883 RepID=A0AA97IZ26_EUBMA|nr:gallinacin-13-like [Eublepharis macularius]